MGKIYHLYRECQGIADKKPVLLNWIVSKADIGGEFLGIRVGNPGELTVGVIGVVFDLAFRILQSVPSLSNAQQKTRMI